ncbi:MAG: helix-turn-helix domain-containing protein [Acidilobaceae archaeon]
MPGAIEVCIKVYNSDCPLIRFLKSNRIKVEFYNVYVSSTGTRHFLEVGESSKIIARYAKVNGLAFKLVDKRRGLVWIENSSPCTVCRTIDKLKFMILSFKLSDDLNPVYAILAPYKVRVNKLTAQLRENNIDFEVICMQSHSNMRNLTTKQVRVLLVAYKMGFFEVPKKANLEDLSKFLGIKPSTLDEILRRAIKKLIESQLSSVK